METLTVKAREPAHTARNGAPRGEQGLAEIVKSTAADVVHLATAELRLAKAEFSEGVRAQAGRAALFAVGLVPLSLGYLLGVLALVTWLRPLLGLPGALGAAALSQAALGGIIVAVAWPRPGVKAWGETRDSGAGEAAGVSGA
jgi:uncharacterized membrane protein YqjE